ncbi:hypothetical protein EAF00_000784 [Botryotinia globosa]|nr:hypothetical protein EAF00_000784 [Botryotinia globosa]
MAEKRDRYGTGGDPSIAQRGNGIGGRGYNGRAPPNLGFDGEGSSVSGRGQNDRRYGSMPPNTPMTPYTPFTPYTPVTAGYDGGESFISAQTPRHDHYYGGESAVGGRPAVTPGAAGYRGGEGSYNGGTPQTGRFNGGESYAEGRAPRPGRYDIAESTMSVDTPRTGRFDPGMESSIAHPDTPRTAHYDTTATTMSMDPSRTGTYDKENTITVAEYYDPERAREHERRMMEREKSERERGMRQPSGMEYGPRPTEYLSTSGSSTSSYLDISRHFPTKGFSFRSFFSTPSEKSDSKKKKEKKKKSKKLTKHNSSSSSSLNEDLAFGTGFLRYRRKRSVRARDGRDRQWETIGYKSSKENLKDTRSSTNSRPTSSKRPTTDAEILALGAGIAGLAKLALDHGNKDARNGKNGRGGPETVNSSRRDERGLPPSKTIPYETDPNDDEGWESASDDESDSSVDTGLAFGGGSHVGKKPQAGLFGRKKTHGPKSRKSNVVDPRLLGPENSLNGYLSDRAVGFEDVQWESGSDFGQHTYISYSHPDRQVDTLYAHERVRISRTQSVGSGSQTPLQEVFPVPTNDPSRFDVARASSSEYNASRPAPVPIQQPQPITPVSHSVYHESNYVRSESGGILKSSSGRSKSLASAALAGVAGAAVGAAIASSRRDDNENYRDDDRRDNRSYSESAVNRKERRYEEDQYSIADSSAFKPRDEDRKERRRDYDQSSIADSNLTWDEKREKRREERRKDDSRSSTSNSDRDKNRERSRDDPDAAAEERERRRRERREERRAPDRIEDNYEERRAHVLSEISAMARAPTDPFQYQVADTPPREESSGRQAKDQSAPTVVTVEREPDFNRKQNSMIKESSSISRSESRTEISIKVEKEQRYKEHARTLHDAEMIYEETEHSTAPIEAAAIAAAAAALARESRRESRSSKRRGERRTDSEDLSKDGDSAEAPGQSHDEVMAEADRAYREILMARKVAAEVRRSRTPSPERSVMNKYEEESEEEPPRIVTPPGMHERKKGPYDAPNADFKLDFIMTPRDLKVYSIPSRRYKVDEADLKGPFMTKDADAKLPRPMLNLIRPTPTSTPSPEKQFATMAKNENVKKESSNRSDDRPVERRRSEPEPEPERHSKTKDRDGESEQPSMRSQDEPAQPQTRNPVEDREKTPLYRSQDKPSDTTQIREQTPSYRSQEESHDQDHPKRDRRDIPPIIIGPRGDLIRSSDASVPSPTQSTVSKAVTWGPNETKHFEVESPTETKDEYTSESSPETPEKPRFSEPRFSEPKSGSPTEPKSPSSWAAMAAGIIGAGVGAVVAGSSESPQRAERPESPKKPERAEVSELARILKARESERPESPKRAEISELARILKEREKERPESPQRAERPESPKKPERAEVSELARILKARESERPESPKRAEISELARILKERESERPESPKRAEVSELARILKAREQERNERPYEYRGVVVEPESPHGEPRRDSPPRDMGRDSLYRGVIVEPESPYGESFRDVDRDSLYRGVTVEPESPYGEMRSQNPPRDNRRESLSQHRRRDSPPSVGPKPISPQTSHMPGAFDDDLDFTATVAAGLQDSGFDPNLVVDDLAFRKRDSPPGSNEYKTPWAESIDDLSNIPGESSSNRGFVMGEVPETPKDWSSVSPANEESPNLDRKEQKRLEKERRRSGGDVSSPITDVIVEEPEDYFDTSRQSKKEQRRRDKEEARTQSLLREESSFVDILPNREIVEEPESYVEPVDTPKKSKKSSRSSTYEDVDLDSSASKPKRKSSKRSSTYDGKVESPLRESRRTFSMDDIKNGDESKIPRKSKRDSVRFDSPPPEVDSESGRSLRRKSKDKLRSKSERYDSPDPSQISLPASDNNEDMELSRDPDRPSRRDGDDPLWASSRSILSAGSSSKVDEEDSPQKNRKDRSSTKENNDVGRPIASEPTRDDNEDLKKKTKEATPKKSGGLFGFFSGAKAEAAKEELTKGSRDDPDDVKKKKKKRSSTSDGITEGQSFSDSQLVSSETNGQKTRGEDGVQDSRNDGERKRSKSSDSKKGSFLDNAGILGAGAGLAAGAIAISAQHQQQHAANNNDSEGSTGDMGKLEREEDILDPEIIERQIRPSIDPQYGDLLPLPPSGSVSPNCEPIDDLPKLPESRPTTPESEKRTETPVKSPSQSAVPLKFVMGNRFNPASPIITRSTGNTPFLTFHPSPIAESATIPRSRSRPMSWDNTKEFKPLYLLETNRRGSFVPEEIIDPLPHLPPSRTNSELDVADLPESGFLEKLDLHRPSPDPLSTNLPSDDHTSGESTPTAITFKRDLAPSVEFLQDSFPSLEEKQTLSFDAFHEQSSSESVAKAIGAAGIATAAGLAIASHGTRDEQEPSSSQEIQEKSGNDDLQYSSESHDIPSERGETLQILSGTPSNQTMSIEEEVEQTEEFPLSNSKKNEDKGLTLGSDDIHDQAENTPEPIQELSSSVEGDNVKSVDNFSTPESKNDHGKNGTVVLSQEPELELQNEIPSQEDTQGPKPDYASSELHDVTGPDRDLIEQEATSEAQLIEYPTQDSEEEKVHEKADQNGLSFEPELKTRNVDSAEPFKPIDEQPSIDESADEPQQQVQETGQMEEALPSVEIDQIEELSVPKSKKDRKKDKKKAKAHALRLERLTTEPIVESMIEVPTREPSLEVSSEIPREISLPSPPLASPEAQAFNGSVQPENSGDITPTVSEFASPESKRDKKKSKKSKQIPVDPQPEQAVVQPELNEAELSQSEDVTRNPLDLPQELVQEPIQAEPTTPVNAGPIEEFSTPKSKKSKKDERKAKKEQIANVEQDPVDVTQEQEQVPELQENELPEALTFEETPNHDDTTHAIVSPSSKKNRKKSKNGKTADIEGPMEPTVSGPIPEDVSEKPTPMVGPGAWPITPATPWTAGTQEVSSSNEKDYFPAAETILPIITAGDTVIGAEQLKSNDISEDKNGSDSLTTEHEDNQLGLANQSQEELKPQEIVIEDVSKGLGDDVTDSNGLPAGFQEDESSLPRQLPAEIEDSIQENHPSQEERDQVSAIETQEEEKPISNETEARGGFEAGYEDDQQELSKDLKEELDSGSAKDERDDESEKHAGQDQNEGVLSDIASSDNPIKDLNEPANIPTPQSEIIEDPAIKAVLEEPEEIAQADKTPQMPVSVEKVIKEETPLEETSTIVQEPETIENTQIDQDFPEPATTEKTPINSIISAPEPEVESQSKECKEPDNRESLLASNPSNDMMTPGTSEEKKPVDASPEHLEPEHLQGPDEASIAINPKPESATLDKSQDNVIEPTPIEEVSVSENVDQVNIKEDKTQGEESTDVKQEIPDMPLKPSTIDREIEFSAPPKKSEKDKNKRGKQAQDSIEDDTVAKDIKSIGESSNIGMPIEQPNTMPVEQIITIPAKEQTPNDAPMTAGLSGLMGPLTGRKKGVLEMVQALGWGKKKDKAAIAAAEQGLPPRPSTARAASESFMSTPRVVSESAMPKVIETEPVKAPSPTTELEEWALADENPKRNSKKGKKIANEDLEPVPSTIIEEEPLPIEPKEETAQKIMEPSVTKSSEDVQDDQSSRRQKGKQRLSLQSFISEEASKAFRARESANQGPETPSLVAEPAFIEQSPELTSEPIIDASVEEMKNTESMIEVPTMKLQEDEKKRRSSQSSVSEEMPEEEADVSIDAAIERELKPQAPEIDEPSVESGSEPSELQRGPTSEESQAPEVSNEDAPESVVETARETEELDPEAIHDDRLTSSPQPEQIPEHIVENQSQSSEPPHSVDPESLFVPEPLSEDTSKQATFERSNESSDVPRKVIQDDDDNVPQASFDLVTEPSAIGDEASPPNESTLEKATKNVDSSEPSLVDESFLPNESIQDDIMASVEYVEPDISLEESGLSVEPLSEEFDNTIEVQKPDTFDGPTLPSHIVFEEDSREVEAAEPSHNNDQSILPQEPLLEETDKDADGSLTKQVIPREESGTLETFEPSHTDEETILSTEPSATVGTVQAPSELVPAEETEVQDESTLPSTKKSKKSKKNKKSKNKSQSEPEVPIEVTREPEETLLVEKQILEKPFDTTESSNREALEQPLERSVEPIAQESRDVLEPASVPLPEDDINEAIELDEPTNFESLQPSLNLGPSIPIPEGTIINPETEEPKSLENLDHSEYAASIPLPEDIVMNSTEDIELQVHEPAEALEPVSDVVEKTIETPSDNEIPASKETLEFSEPMSSILEKYSQELAPVSPERSRKDKKKRKSATPMPLAEESLSSDPLLEIETKAVEPLTEEARLVVSEPPIDRSSEEVMFSKPQEAKFLSELINPETEQKGIEPMDAITTPSISDGIEHVSQGKHFEPPADVPTEESKREMEEQKSEVPILDSGDLNSQTSLGPLPIQADVDVSNHETVPNFTEPIPESVPTANEDISIPTLTDVEVKQEDTPKSGLNVSLDHRDLESGSKDTTDLPETNSSDAPVKELKEDETKRKSLDTSPFELPMDSTTEIPELSQPINQASEEELHGIEPVGPVREIVQRPTELQEHPLEQEQTEEDFKVLVEPVIESIAPEPSINISHGPTVESENVKEDDLTPQEPIVQQESSSEPKSIDEPSLVPHQIIEPEAVNGETLLPQNAMINSIIDDKEAPQLQKFEPEIRNGESILPQESTVESPIREEPNFQQELETMPEVSNFEPSLVQNSIVEPIPEEEQIVVEKQVIELNIPEPAQIALPESPIEQKSFEQELSFLQESLTKPEVIEEAPIVQHRATSPQSPDIKLVIPQELPLQENAVDPAQISLPESPIEWELSELEIPSQQEFDSESHVVEEPSLSREHHVEPKSSHPELVNHSEWPIEQKNVEPEQIALPESPIEEESFEPEVLFRQGPVVESQDRRIPSISSELVLEEKAGDKELSFPQDIVDPEITEKAPIPHEQDIDSKISEQELVVPQELPTEQSNRQPSEVSIEEPVSESITMDDMSIPQESSIEPTKLESDMSISDIVTEESARDLEPVFPNESGKNKEEGEQNLDFSETSGDPTNVTFPSQVPENQALENDSESTTFDSNIKPVSSSPDILSESFEPIADVEKINPDFVESTSNTEPIASEQAIDSALEMTSVNSTLENPVHDQPLTESLLAETEPTQRDEWARPIEESKEAQEKGDDVLQPLNEQSNVAPQAPEITSTPLEITDTPFTGDDVKELAKGDITETDEDSFLDAVESFSLEDTPMNLTPRASREPVEAVEPEFEELTQEPAEKSVPEVIKPLHEEEFNPAPMPETVQQNDDAFPSSEEITLEGHRSIPAAEPSKNDLPQEMLNEERPKEEHRPADDDVTGVLTKNSKDINDREFGFSSPVQFIPKDTQIGVPDVVEPVPTEITLDDFKAIPTGDMPKEVQQQTEDEWGTVSTKKLRKDKERLESTLSTPLEPEVPNVATELPEDNPPNCGKLEELLPTIEDVPDTHTSFQIPQVDKIVSEHDPFDMSHDKLDKKGKGISSRERDPESEIPALANTVAVSDIQDVKPGERLLTSPIPIRNTVPTSNSITEPDMLSSPSSSSFKPLIDESNNLSAALVEVPLKKDKRKRQATINLETPQDDQRTFWAGEVPEAEVIRAVPVIEDIGRDEFYSHIASTVKESEANEFSRPPAKKGKKNKKRESTDIRDFQSLMGEDLSRIEPTKERKEMPSVAAATAAIVGAAVLASKSKESEVEAVEEEEIPMAEKLSEEEHRLSMDKIAPSDDVSDDSLPREDKDPKVFEEMKGESGETKNDECDSDGFRERSTILQESEQIGNIRDPVIETSDKAAAVEPQEIRTPRSLSPVLDIARFTQEPEQIESMQQKEFAERSESDKVERSILHEPEGGSTIQEPKELISPEHAEDEDAILQEPEQMEAVQKPTTQIPADSTIVERQIVQESEQIGASQEPMAEIHPKPWVMEGRESVTPTPRHFDPNDDKTQEMALAAQSYASSSSSSPRRSPPAREPRGDLPEEYLSRLSRRDIEKKRRKKSIEVGDNLDLLPAPIQEALRNTIVEPRARETSPSPISSPKAERAKRARSRSRPPSRPGTPGLTMLREESEDENTLSVENRDSAFIGDSPIPPQGNFADKHEDIRDSGIHLRDNSPSMRVRAPVSSTDAAIDSMAWPSVDEDAGTVDLEQPQRPKVVEDLTRYGHGIDDLPSQRRKEEGHTDLHRTQAIHRAHSPHEEKHKLTRKTSLSRGELAEANHVDFVRSQRLKAFQTKSKEKLSEPLRAEAINKPVTPEKEHRRHRVHRSEFPDLQYRKPKENKYGDLQPVKTPKTSRTEQRSVSESSPSLIGSAALAAAGSGFAAARKLSQESRPLSAQSHKSQRSASNISVTRLRTPVPLDAPQAPQFPDSAKTNRSFTPPLRRSARKISGDPRSLRQQSNIDLAKEIDPASINTATSTNLTNTANPTANEGRARAQDMADVYDGYGEGHMGSPRSPTRPHSMRRRQSMQVLELESKLDQLTAENRALAESKAHAEHMLRSSQGAPAALVERDAQIDLLKRTLSSMQDEVKRLTEVNAGLSSAAVTLGQQHNARYGTLESQHAQTSRELQQAREAHHNLQSEVQGVIHNAIQERDQEIASLRSQLDVAKEQIRAMQREILAAKAGDAQFLIIRDEDYFDNACQQLCQHVQQWVLRFSKFSDMRACRLTSEINNDKTIDRLDNAILDGSDVDSYLADRVRRRDVFMSMTMTMVWEFIFTRYLFGMDREQRQKLKSLEKVLSEVGPPSAVHQWRATTLTLLSKRESFARQKEQDTLAVVHAVLETLTEILPPPSHLEGQIEEQLKRVIKAAVDLSIEMRTQRAEYMMLPPLQPEYDANGDLASKVSFNAALMNERSGDTISNEELEAQRAVVRVVLFPLVVKKGDDLGQGDEEIVVCPAQVLVAKPRMGKGLVGRVYSPASGADIDRRSDRSRTPASLQSSMPDTNVI